MAFNVRDIETYQDTKDAFALMSIIKIAEKDIETQKRLTMCLMAYGKE